MSDKNLQFDVISDRRGSLIALEQNKNIPFHIKRVYYLYNLDYERSRGFHAHRKLKQVAICLKGKCSISLDDGKDKQTVFLGTPSKGLFIDNLVWHTMQDFTDDCILMVLASDFYDENDYIRDYNIFLEEIIG